MYISPHEQFNTASKDSRTIEEQRRGRPGRRLGFESKAPCGLTRTRVRLTRRRFQKRKSLQTTETTSNTVRDDIVRATAAPHPNADGPPAHERAPAPL